MGQAISSQLAFGRLRISGLMDQGVDISATIAKLRPGEETWRAVKLRVDMVFHPLDVASVASRRVRVSLYLLAREACH